MKKHLVTCVAAFVFSLAMTVNEQFALAETLSDPQLAAFTRTPFYARFLNHTFAALPPEVFQRCSSLSSAGSSVTVLKPTTFAADGYPNSGIWRQDFPISGCGNDPTLHFYFSATPEEKINSLSAVPGETHASLQLQNDALSYVKNGVAALGVACQQLYATNTKFEGYGESSSSPPVGSASSMQRAWREMWMLAGCGHSYKLSVNFVPDSTGTRIDVGPASATN